MTLETTSSFLNKLGLKVGGVESFSFTRKFLPEFERKFAGFPFVETELRL